MSRLSRLASVVVLLPTVAVAQQAPLDDHVLFVSLGGSYTTDGLHMHDALLTLDPNADYVNLRGNTGAAAALLAANTYDQIWVYDLSSSNASVDSHTADFVAIAEWFLNESGGEVICDGRYLSSFWRGQWPGGTEWRHVTDNYYTNLAVEGGGVMLATDHNSFANHGINELNGLLGLGPFIGNFPTQAFPVDTTNPLMNTPHLITSLRNDSSTGQPPFGLQPGGLILDTVGFHSGDPQKPGISSTIDGSLNLAVSIDSPGNGDLYCPPDDAITLTASSEGVTGDITYTWSSNVDGELGTGETLELGPSELTPGPHDIRVIAQDNRNIDDADITIQVGGDNCDDDDDGVINGEDQCEGFPDDLDEDGDNVPDDCDDCFGLDNGSDEDSDGVCDDADPCFGDNETLDLDNDGICGSDDQCEGDDAQPDTDGDGICEDIDQCLGDDAQPDTDGDGICEDIDECTGDDASPDTDGDGICEDIDQCIGDDASPDLDGDGICEDIDLCLGDDASGDSDDDGHCDDLDCGVDDDTRYPGAEELCNGIDDDCDEVVPDAEFDNDGDLVLICGGDCDDEAASVYEGAPELCDAIDNDCDDEIDEDFEDTNNNGILDCAEVDEDDDGVFPYDGDCDNNDPTVYAGALELCDGLDNDCDGIIPDVERDGDGDDMFECEGDCDDTVDTTYNGAPELCDDVDNDCDGDVDEDFEDTNNDGVVDCLEEDQDGDGVTPAQGDCDDLEANASPNAEEVCDGIDNNCDGLLPEDEQDFDGDGVMACEGDCDDDNADVYPGNTEVNDGLDNDCDDTMLADENFIAGGCNCATGGSSAPAWPLLPLLLTGLMARRSRSRLHAPRS